MTRFCPVAPGDNLSKMLESMMGSWSAPTRIVIESGEEESSGGMLDEGEELPSESPESLICAKHAGYTWGSEKGGIHQGLSLDTHVMRTAHIGPR